MTEFMEALAAFCSTKSFWVYVLIFFGKFVEVSMCTLRHVLINRGLRKVGAVLAVIESLLWLIVVGAVLSNYKDDALKMLVYAVAFGAGNFMGSWLDEKLALGLASVQVVVPDEEREILLGNALRASGFGVSTATIAGRDGVEHALLMMTMKRKHLLEAEEIILRIYPEAVITISDVKTQKGGYMKKSGPPMFRVFK